MRITNVIKKGNYPAPPVNLKSLGVMNFVILILIKSRSYEKEQVWVMKISSSFFKINEKSERKCKKKNGKKRTNEILGQKEELRHFLKKI